MPRRIRINPSFADVDSDLRNLLDSPQADSSVTRIKKILLDIIKNELTPRQSQIIMLYYFQGLTLPQIASSLNLSVPSVSITMKRARYKLFRILKYII
ncbi:MAG: sigma-70 family RNA polymerase sigma factor [Ruminococcus sp.]|nr:sigma-70 family RNA polymerase sigma factor [Ruminococcus sp.]